MFADKVEIEVRAGKGGDGKLSFRREKYNAFGGPDGGDGGRGASIIIEVDHNLDTLSKYRTNRLVRADAGAPGGENRRAGKAGTDVVIKVPVGTLVYEVSEDNRDLLADLAVNGQTFVAAKGGRGGFGNAHFTASTRQAPKIAELGEPGETKHLMMELKLVADVGLVGLPNAGKSTLLSVISNARPEIGDYAFTTLIPNLGVAKVYDTTILVADIPGLIEGASTGKGLGDEFLRHIERTSVLLHLVDVNSPEPVTDYATIQHELASYHQSLIDKPQLVVLTKVETVLEAELEEKRAQLEEAIDGKVYPISAQTHQGLDAVLQEAAVLVQEDRQQRREQEEAEELPVIELADLPSAWSVEKLDDGFRITGERIEAFAVRTNFDNDEAVDRLRHIMRRIGIARDLERQGLDEDSKIYIGDHAWFWFAREE
jgi:GTP-binding protein